METKTIIALLFILTSSIVHAQVAAEGGNITPVNLAMNAQTQRWQGYAGRIFFITPDGPPSLNATGGNINATSINITSLCTNPTSVTGVILFSNSSTMPSGLVLGNLTLLDNFIMGGGDSGTRTFTQTSTFDIGGTISNVPTTFTYVNSNPQSSVFREGYLNDASGNLVFAIDVNLDTQGYNASFFDFQAILPTPNTTTTTYFLTTSLTIVCPAAPAFGGGGGGGGRGCTWYCDPFGECIDGLQNRTCRPAGRCTRFPSLTRTCSDEPRHAMIIPEEELARELHEVVTQTNIPLEFTVMSTRTTPLPMRITNPNAQSLEHISAQLRIPNIQPAITPLHTRPMLYNLFGTTILPPEPDTTWHTPSETITIKPYESRDLFVLIHAPILRPTIIPSTLELYSGDILLATRPINIKVDVPPFAVVRNKRAITTLIDNRNYNQRTTTMELDFNKHHTTQAVELYTLTLPANGVALFGNTFVTSYEFDHVLARIGDDTVEAR